jgi:signal transduction histidine kinase
MDDDVTVLLVDIYPASLQSAGLAAALTDLVGGLAARGVVVRLDLPTDSTTGLTADQEQVVYRVAQETLRNAVAHAHAGEVRLRLTRTSDVVVLEVADDGVGFDVQQALAAPAEGHFGLRLLSDVATSSGAQLEVGSAPDAGCRWRLTLDARRIDG